MKIRPRSCRTTLKNGQRSNPVVDPELVPGQRYTRATIMSELARVLRQANASTTNIESAVARTTVSADDIAAQFGGNRELILAMVAELSDAMSRPLTVRPTKGNLRQRLIEFGQCVTEIYSASHLRCLYRIAVNESSRNTGLGRNFYEVGPGRLTQRLADYLRIASAEGALSAVDPDLLASHFLSPLQILLDVGDDFSHRLATNPAARRVYVRNMVDLFCRGINGGKHLC